MNGDRKANADAFGALRPQPISLKALVLAFKTKRYRKQIRSKPQASLRADVSYFLCFTRDAKEIGDVCTQASLREKNTQLPAAVRVSKTSLVKLSY